MQLFNRLSIRTWFKTKAIFIVIALFGLALAVIITKSTPTMIHNSAERPSTSVNFITVAQHQLSPEIIGFGTVKPDLDLQAKAEVTGRIVYIHPKLKKGEIFAKDTVLLKIDDKDYLLQIKQAEADLLVNQANLTEMQLSIDNNQLELALALEKLTVRENEYARKQKLSHTGAVSPSALSVEKQAMLQQKQEVQQLTNKKSTLPSQLKVMTARLAIAQAKLEKSQRDLQRTQITLPFTGRISQVYTELDQFIATSAPLFDAVGLEKITITAQFPLDQFSAFANNFDRKQINITALADMPNMETMLNALQLRAKVDEVSGAFKSWQGKIERFSDNLDPKSRTVGVVISVENSYRDLEPGSKPPLLQGMYMKITLQGKASTFMVLPRFALHQDQVYQITADNQLKRLTLKQLQYKGELILLKSQLNIGDRIITSDVFPAVDGMLVTPIKDNLVQTQLDQWLEVTP